MFGIPNPYNLPDILTVWEIMVKQEPMDETRRVAYSTGMELKGLAQQMIGLGASASGVVKVGDIIFAHEFRAACEQNSCGKYGTNWMCPPGVGEFEELKTQVGAYSHGIVFQTISQLEDSFDFEGMEQAKTAHTAVFHKIIGFMRQQGLTSFLPLNAGECRVCQTCTYPDAPCRFPEQAVASIESYGIDVHALVTSCGLNYINGKDTVSYVGMVLL